jgi:hypothetical protein
VQRERERENCMYAGVLGTPSRKCGRAKRFSFSQDAWLLY